MKRLSSSHFVIITMPVPSHARSLSRSILLERKMKTSPQYGLAFNAWLTSAASEFIPLRKSTGCDATTIFNPARTTITEGHAMLTEPPAMLRHRRRQIAQDAHLRSAAQ